LIPLSHLDSMGPIMIREGLPLWTDKNRAKYSRDHLRYPSDLTDDEWAHEGDKATLTPIKGGFGQLTAVGVVGNIAWVAESRFSQRSDPNKKDPGPWVVTPVTLP
jgi:hypothetical protein